MLYTQGVVASRSRIAVDGGNGDGIALDDATAQEANEDAWQTAKALMKSVTRDELLDPNLSPENIVFRLFNSMAPHIAQARPVVDQCRCNVEKMELMLKQLAVDEVNELADDNGNLTVTCEFCKVSRAYNKDTISLL